MLLSDRFIKSSVNRSFKCLLTNRLKKGKIGKINKALTFLINNVLKDKKTSVKLSQELYLVRFLIFYIAFN